MIFETFEQPPPVLFTGPMTEQSLIITGWGSILDNLAKDNKDNGKFYLYLYLR